MNIDYGFPVELIRTDRTKSASIQLDGNIVKIVVPKTLSLERVDALIQKRSAWIKEKLEKQRTELPVKAKEYVSGEVFQYLGRNYRLKRTTEPSRGVKMKAGYLCVSVGESLSNELIGASIKMLLEGWYKDHAAIKLKEKTLRYAAILGLKPTTIKVRDYKARWGSCSSLGGISYNWRIIMAPHSIVDYVVVHELCHMVEHNHSAKYWRHVENLIADYKLRREWLKFNGEGLIV